MIVMREVIGEELRRRRQDQGRTLREVSGAAAVSLGYLSEVERGHKEASSELLAAICDALEVSLSDLLASVSTHVAQAELQHTAPTTRLPQMVLPGGSVAPSKTCPSRATTTAPTQGLGEVEWRIRAALVTARSMNARSLIIRDRNRGLGPHPRDADRHCRRAVSPRGAGRR